MQKLAASGQTNDGPLPSKIAADNWPYQVFIGPTFQTFFMKRYYTIVFEVTTRKF